MKTEWKKCKLSSQISLIGGGTPKTSVPEYWNGEIPWLSVKDFNDDNRYVYKTEKYITQAGLEHSSTTLLQKDDIIISARGTVGEMAMIPFPMAFNQSCYGIRGKENNDQTFIYYLIKNSVRKLKAITHGSVFDTITRETFDNIEVTIPPLTVQKKIAGVLKSLDDKIELNRQISKNLEEQAQAIYENTFITNTQSNWKWGYLSDLIDVKYGKDHKKFSDGIYPVYGSGGVMRYIEKPLYSKESVLVPRKGTLNNVIYVNEPFWSVDTMFYTEMKRTHIAKFIFHFLKNKNLAALNAGSAVPSMTTNILNAMELPIPDDSTFLIFDNLVTPLYTKIQANEKQSLHLAQIRDTILPKLMSGEIEV